MPAASAGSTPSLRAASRKTSGAGLPRPTSSDETQVRKASPQPEASITRSMTCLFEDDASASGQRAAIRATASSAPGSSGSRSLVALEHVRDDAIGDLRRLERHAQRLVHVARPLRRAHAEHRLGRPVGPLEPVLGDERPAPAVPGGLRVEQQAVEVEDDGADQAGDRGIEPRARVLETAMLTVTPVPQDRRPRDCSPSVRRWCEHVFVSWTAPDPWSYSYLLGMYLGDGWVGSARSAPAACASRSTSAYPEIVDATIVATQMAAPRPSRDDSTPPRTTRGLVVSCYAATGATAFPQYGAGAEALAADRRSPTGSARSSTATPSSSSAA